jgi:hypothetical protein
MMGIDINRDTSYQYTAPALFQYIGTKPPGEFRGNRIHEDDLLIWKGPYSLTVRNGDRSFRGETLGKLAEL